MQHFCFTIENNLYIYNEDKREDRALFPRVDYNNEWLPVGRGDPLKDPTYDYMPPVLDRVRYWAEGTSHKNKNDILLLGVASKKLSSNKQKEKYNYGPIKRTYYSPPYQHHYQPQPQHQKQQPHMQQYVKKILCSSFIQAMFLIFLTYPTIDRFLNI